MWEKVLEYVWTGWHQHEKVVCLASTDELAELTQRLTTYHGGVEVGGWLQLVDWQESYVANGYFDPARMHALARTIALQAKQEGYVAVRAVGEMGWILADLPGSEQVVEYEESLHQVLAETGIRAVCKYDETKFDPGMIHLMKRIHAHED